MTQEYNTLTGLINNLKTQFDTNKLSSSSGVDTKELGKDFNKILSQFNEKTSEIAQKGMSNPLKSTKNSSKNPLEALRNKFTKQRQDNLKNNFNETETTSNRTQNDTSDDINNITDNNIENYDRNFDYKKTTRKEKSSDKIDTEKSNILTKEETTTVQTTENTVTTNTQNVQDTKNAENNNSLTPDEKLSNEIKEIFSNDNTIDENSSQLMKDASNRTILTGVITEYDVSDIGKLVNNTNYKTEADIFNTAFNIDTTQITNENNFISENNALLTNEVTKTDFNLLNNGNTISNAIAQQFQESFQENLLNNQPYDENKLTLQGFKTIAPETVELLDIKEVSQNMLKSDLLTESTNDGFDIQSVEYTVNTEDVETDAKISNETTQNNVELTTTNNIQTEKTEDIVSNEVETTKSENINFSDKQNETINKEISNDADVIDDIQENNYKIEMLQADTSGDNQSFSENPQDTFIKMNIENFETTDGKELKISSDFKTILNRSSEKIQTTTIKNTQQSEIINQVKEQIGNIKGNFNSKVSMILQPEHLGKVSVEILSDKGVVKANIVAQNPMVKDMLEKNIDALKNTLTSQGVSVANVSVQVEKNAEAQQGNLDFTKQSMEQDFANSSSNKNQGNSNLKENQTKLANGEEFEFETEETETDLENKTTVNVHNGKVDLKV